MPIIPGTITPKVQTLQASNLKPQGFVRVEPTTVGTLPPIEAYVPTATAPAPEVPAAPPPAESMAPPAENAADLDELQSLLEQMASSKSSRAALTETPAQQNTWMPWIVGGLVVTALGTLAYFVFRPRTPPPRRRGRQ